MSNLPDALRVGTPVSERPEAGRTSTGGSKISDTLFESRRRSSATSTYSNSYGARRDVSPAEGDLGILSSPVSEWAPSRTTSMYALPPLPSLSEDTAYAPVASNEFASQGIQHVQPSRTKSLLQRGLGSLRTPKLKKKRPYNPLHDVGEDEESIGFDISDQWAPGPTIELVKYNMFASALPVSHGLGGGMDLVKSANIKSPAAPGHKRGDSYATPELREQIQLKAQAEGHIVAVEEEVFDLGMFDGGDTRSLHTASIFEGDATTNKAGEKSYFFPDDPEKPSWKPHSMRWPYLTLLIVIALGLGAVQEMLCQFSMRSPDGLLSFKHPSEIPTASYFTWKYAPTIVLVTYGVMWQVADYEIKRLEPYYQLSKPGGATARASLNVDYLTLMSYFIPFMAIRYKHWAVVFSSIATLIAGTVLAVLQSAAINTRPRPDDLKIVIVDPIWSRCLSVSLLLVAILGIALMFSLNRKSGLWSDPKGVAGIASMATKSHILTDFKDLDLATNSVIHDKLRNRRYILHKSSLWQGEYVRSADKATNPNKKENPHPIMLRLWSGIPFILYIVAFAGLLPAIIFVPIEVITQKVPWFLTALATSIKLLWSTLDITIRVMEPYWVLSRRAAQPKTLTLDYTGTVPFLLSAKAAINGHWLVFSVATGAIFTEVLTVCVTSFTVDGKKFMGDDKGDAGDNSNNSETV